jgi:hypothetical protein
VWDTTLSYYEGSGALPLDGCSEPRIEGAWTDVWPVVRGEHWRAVFDAPLSPLEVDFG